MKYPSKIYIKQHNGEFDIRITPDDTYRCYELVPASSVSEEDIIRVVDYWKGCKHLPGIRNVDQKIKQLIKKAIDKYSIEDVLISISNYSETLQDNSYYMNYVWDIKKFFTQSNTLPDYMTDGVKWINYCKYKEEQAKKIKPWSSIDVSMQNNIKEFCKKRTTSIVLNMFAGKSKSEMYSIYDDVYPLVFSKRITELSIYLDSEQNNEFNRGSFIKKFDKIIFKNSNGSEIKTIDFESELKKYNI